MGAPGISGNLNSIGSDTLNNLMTFWAESFGMLTDRFGTAWMINGGAQH